MMNFGRILRKIIGFSCKKIIRFFVWCEKKIPVRGKKHSPFHLTVKWPNPILFSH